MHLDWLRDKLQFHSSRETYVHPVYDVTSQYLICTRLLFGRLTTAVPVCCFLRETGLSWMCSLMRAHPLLHLVQRDHLKYAAEEPLTHYPLMASHSVV
jgi:hypothetical protein